MKIQIISDLHYEFGQSPLQLDNPDILIIAGDLNVATKGINWLIENVTNIPVIYVLGNHEYYKGNYPKTLHKIKEAARNSNIHVLENEAIVLEDIKFHGATLWTDFEIFGDPAVYGQICQAGMNDYRKIRFGPSYSRLRSVNIYSMHKQSLRWLEESLVNSDAAKNIVITHHAPSTQSIPNIFKKDRLSAAYASDLDNFIHQYQPDYWIHGHIHTASNYLIGKTHIICNPHGYPGEQCPNFQPKLIIEI